MKSTQTIIIFLLLFLLSPFNKAASQSQTDAEKLKEVESYFKSEFQEENYWRTDELLVTATGSQVPVHLAPSVASVITAEKIEAIGARNLNEILETVPGLHVEPSGLNLLAPIWSIRGIHVGTNPQVLLLINGVPLRGLYNSGRRESLRMPVSMISRVEVVRGPGSAIHGADAFSGTVNVITKDGIEIDGTEMGIRYGSFNTTDAWVQHGGVYKGWDIYGSFESQSSNGDKSRVIHEDGLNNNAFAITPGHLDTSFEVLTGHLGLRKDNLTMRFYGFWNQGSGMGPGTSPQVLSYNNNMTGKQLLADILYRDKDFTENLDLSFQLYTSIGETNNFFEVTRNALGPFLGNPIANERYTAFETTAFYDGFKKHLLRFSAGWQFFDIDTDQNKNFSLKPAFAYFGAIRNVKNSVDVFMQDQSRKIWNVSFQDEWVVAPRWIFTGGIRYDYYNDFGSTTNPRAALVWETRYDLTTKLMYGQAYRAPAFAEQYFENNNTNVGNPAIEPETIETFEIAFDYEPSQEIRAKLNLFTYTIDGLIEYSGSAPNGASLAENNKNQKGHGFELEMDWEVFEKLKLNSSFAYQRSKDKLTGEITPDAPGMQLYLNPHWMFMPDWSLDSQFYWIADRHRDNDDPRPDIDDYELVNLTLRRKNFLNHFDLALSIRNVFNDNVRAPSLYNSAATNGAYISEDLPLESRAIWAELKAHF